MEGRYERFGGYRWRGVSAVPPSDLPNWMHFKAAVLDGIGRMALNGLDLDGAEGRQIVDHLDALRSTI